jgi:hypothetical protein
LRIVPLLTLFCCATAANAGAQVSGLPDGLRPHAAQQSDPAANDSAIQGWTGTAVWTIAKPGGREVPATSQANGPAPSPAPAEGNPNFQGYKRDWTPDDMDDLRGAVQVAPMLPMFARPTPGSDGQ